MNSNTIRKGNRTRVLVLMLVPCILVLAVIVVVPVINLVYYSLLNYELSNPMGKKFIGLLNYVKAFGDKEFLYSIWITVLYIAGVIATELPISLLLIEILNYIKKGSGILKAALLPPMVVPPIVAGVMWRIIYHPTSGLLNYLLSPLGIQHAWLADRSTSLISLIIVDIWQYTPFLTLILLAGRSAIPYERYEAGMIDGANRFQMFRYITLPLLRNSLMVGILFRVIDSIKVFPTIHIMTAGGPGNATTTINYYTYKMAFSYTDIGYSSALGFILLILTTLFSFVLVRSFKSKGDA
jgi:multiple sugar transport system permease protein